MATAGLAALFQSCMDSLKSILTSQEFGAEYELLCTELSLQSLRFRLWGNSVGLDVETNSTLDSSIINRQDLQPTFDQAVSSIAYLLKEVEDLRRKYQLKRPLSVAANFKDDAKSLRASQSRRSLSSFKSTFVLGQRMRENQKQNSFLAIAKWAICDAGRFDEKVRRLKLLIDGLEDVTKAARFSHPHPETTVIQSISTLQDENPPPYSATLSPSQPDNLPAERVEQSPPPEAAVQIYESLHQASLSALLKCIPVMKGFLSVCPGESRFERLRVQSKLLALSPQQFQELSEDVHDELVRRQRHDDHTPQWLPPDASLHPKRNEARRKLSTLNFLRFPHLVADTVFEFERRFPHLQGRVVSPPQFDNPFIDGAFPHQNRRWGLCTPNDPPPPIQHLAAHQSTNIDPASLTPIPRGQVPTSSFSAPRNFSRNRMSEPLQMPPEPTIPPLQEDPERTPWPMDRVVSWLASNNFSRDWQETFKALNVCGSMFLDLGNRHGGRGQFGMMNQRIYPCLALQFQTSGTLFIQAVEREEGKRMRRLIRQISSESTEEIPQLNPASKAEIFKSFRVSMEDPTWKILPVALKKYDIVAPWEQYALYINYGDQERRLEMDEKPLRLFKTLDKEGKKPMFMLKRIEIVPVPSASAASLALKDESPVGTV